MAGFVKTRFQFDGEDSYAYNLSLVKGESGGLTSTPIAGGRSVNQKQPARYDKPFFYFVQSEPIEIELNFMPYSGEWSVQNKNDIFKWLYGKRQYCDFSTYDDYDSDLLVFRKVYKIIFNSPLELVTADLTKGFITLKAIAYPFAYTPYELYSIAGGESQTIENKQNVTNWDNTFNYKPNFIIQVNGDTDLSIINHSDGDRTFEITDLELDVLRINNSLMIIESENDNLIIQNFNKNWFYLIEGYNDIEVVGDATVHFECEFPILI